MEAEVWGHAVGCHAIQTDWSLYSALCDRLARHGKNHRNGEPVFNGPRIEQPPLSIILVGCFSPGIVRGRSDRGKGLCWEEPARNSTGA